MPNCTLTVHFLSWVLSILCYVVASIVSEAGASIYSASPEAEKELPDMDVTLRGAGKSLRDCAKKKIQKIRDYYESGWVGSGLTRIFVVVETHPKIALNQY